MSLDTPLYTPEESLQIRYGNYLKTQRWNEFQAAIMAHAVANRIPYKGTFELTPRCSLKCKMCYMRLDACQMKPQGRELTTQEWIRMGELALEAGTVDLLLTGGEPMLRPDFAEIYTALSDMGFILRVYTNATLVTPEILQLFEERPPQGMEITLYGASEETYECVGGWGEGFARAVAAIDALRAIVPSIALKTTVIRDNMNDYPAIKALAEARALPLTATTLPSPAVRGATADVVACRMNLDELLAFHKANDMDIQPAECQPPEGDARESLFCKAGLASYCVLWNGTMVACMSDDDPNCPSGKPLEEGFAPVWDRLADFRCNKPLPAPCLTCPIYAECSTCAIHHRVESGSYEIPARYCCDFYRIQRGLQPLPSHDFMPIAENFQKNG